MKSNKKRRKLMIIPLFFSFILLITTTYAWFSANRVVSIESLDVHVQAEGGIEVSTDAYDWKQVITVQDIMNASKSYPSAVNQIPYRVYPVSSGGNITGGYLDLYKGEATNDRTTDFILTASKSLETSSFGEDSDGAFIVFDLFFKTSSEKKLYLSSNSKVEYTGDRQSGIENATRVAFLNEGYSNDAGSSQSLKGASEAVIWEPNYDVHTEYGVSNASKTYGINTSTTSANPISYDGVIADISTNNNVLIQNAKASMYPNLFKTVNVKAYTQKNNTQNVEILTISSSITKLRIYMWIEGQDVDCENNASYGDISYNLEFTTNPS